MPKNTSNGKSKTSKLYKTRTFFFFLSPFLVFFWFHRPLTQRPTAPLLGRQLDPIEDRGRGKTGAHREDADATALRLDGTGEVENESFMVHVYVYIYIYGWLFIYLFIYLLTFWS